MYTFYRNADYASKCMLKQDGFMSNYMMNFEKEWKLQLCKYILWIHSNNNPYIID